MGGPRSRRRYQDGAARWRRARGALRAAPERRHNSCRCTLAAVRGENKAQIASADCRVPSDATPRTAAAARPVRRPRPPAHL
ncbi:unnamed protein product [Euphydryas editha]|uniref:Uncharacterized protein n=1 Tax=Euphydryas editha TaxID=104508 RepID=A0AAU9USR9_EUPED|nr:unnamed protein product [Euphydryas editha]